MHEKDRNKIKAVCGNGGGPKSAKAEDKPNAPNPCKRTYEYAQILPVTAGLAELSD